MIRLIFWIAIVFAVLWLWRKIKPTPRQPAQRGAEQALLMVRCAHCGVHLPQDRALSNGQHWYCTQAHLNEGPAPRER
ncbi:hypothetical protein PMM47T1_18290 [Pseudomonas sp. M47T1]|uniref:PP0621 family protein n=1 Tax=unclassified Pseudomonas TaxID=196821 RepID=UPI0002606BEE|nr:PP0621 family protein [Pseudomonas sp. M47T1]EIK95183.1 hypothetical protein PMM47T1_18290 [Pseudomonas sp. M47T1]